MPRIRLLEPNEAIGKTRELFDEMRKSEGLVPAIFRAYALFPELMEANWEQHKTLMHKGRLSYRLKEAIMLTVADANRCPT